MTDINDIFYQNLAQLMILLSVFYIIRLSTLCVCVCYVH